MVEELNKVDRYCPVTEDISLDDEVLYNAVEKVEEEYVLVQISCDLVNFLIINNVFFYAKFMVKFVAGLHNQSRFSSFSSTVMVIHLCFHLELDVQESPNYLDQEMRWFSVVHLKFVMIVVFLLCAIHWILLINVMVWMKVYHLHYHKELFILLWIKTNWRNCVIKNLQMTQ